MARNPLIFKTIPRIVRINFIRTHLLLPGALPLTSVPHVTYAQPDMEALVGISSFGNPETGGFIFASESDDPELATAPLDPIDDRDLGLAPGQ
jgi:hypothetical protein